MGRRTEALRLREAVARTDEWSARLYCLTELRLSAAEAEARVETFLVSDEEWARAAADDAAEEADEALKRLVDSFGID